MRPFNIRLDHLNRVETSPDPKEERFRLATLRADIDRKDERMYGRPAHSIQDEQDAHTRRHTPPTAPDPDPSRASVQTGQRSSTRAERRAAARALLAEGLTDRKIARRVGISPTTVGTLGKVAS